ncbi:unnamed protein product [Chondrus crispus]|uniref:Uncharacterized protein n=1 Tax=Chondrus crispus TaxID=2769 RepID=R7QPF0_CHOCR|nr:unnamed protein product [Chondrus crispus]CDF40367.1 unnamed protein product [Chondrus crispus]|eukprot:XP_005710661.1 unnamed protein product [Chondrus crispus]
MFRRLFRQHFSFATGSYSDAWRCGMGIEGGGLEWGSNFWVCFVKAWGNRQVRLLLYGFYVAMGMECLSALME